MSGRPVRVVVALAVAVMAAAITVAGPTVAPPASAQEELPPLRILAVGDSYSSGEGLPGIQEGESACQRALGVKAEGNSTPSKAWPVLVKETFEGKRGDGGRVWNADTFWFTACTGNTSDYFTRLKTLKNATQVAEAQADAGRDPWDVITMTFGGNDIDFAGMLQDCIGLDGDMLEGGSLVPGVAIDKLLTGAYAGCELTEAEMKARVDNILAGKLTKLYDEAAEVIKPGGLIVVAGYPQLFEEPSRWPNVNKLRNRCERVSKGDARSLRGAAGRLNEVTGQQVLAAQKRHPKATWLFVDVTGEFEPAQGDRHGLCAKSNWVNGFSLGGITDGDFRALDAEGLFNRLVATFSRSYHPNQSGHEAYSRAVVNAIRASGWKPGGTGPGADVRSFDPRNMTFPANSCVQGGWAASGPITVVNGMGTTGDRYAPDDGTGYAEVFEPTVVGYADVDGDGDEDVVMQIGCTAGGTFGAQIVVPLRVEGDHLELIGGNIGAVSTKAEFLNLAAEYGNANLARVGDARMDGTAILVDETYDATGEECQACHSGRATMRWTWTDGRWAATLASPASGGGLDRAGMTTDGIGDLQFGDPVAEAEALTGVAAKSSECMAPGFSLMVSGGAKLAFSDGLFVRYAVSTGELKTRSGVGVGMSSADVMARLPSAERVSVYDQPTIVVRSGANSIVFWLDDDRVSSIVAGPSRWAEDVGEMC